MKRKRAGQSKRRSKELIRTVKVLSVCRRDENEGFSLLVGWTLPSSLNFLLRGTTALETVSMCLVWDSGTFQSEDRKGQYTSAPEHPEPVIRTC